MDTSFEASVFQRATETAQHLRKILPEGLAKPKIAIVCGSGLGGLADTINPEPKVEISYGDVPGFAKSTVQGHAGKLVFGQLGPKNTPVVLFVGRVHFYEGHPMSLVTYSTRVCSILGITTMIVTNAAGGLNPSYAVGDIVCLNDHLNIPGFVGANPLMGPNIAEFGDRFPGLSDAYSLVLRRLAHQSFVKLFGGNQARKLHEGVYAFLSGPTYETRAECRALRTLGADLVGMSTVPEIVVARHCGMRVLAFSLVTNKAVLEGGFHGDSPEIQGLTVQELEELLEKGKANHAEVLEAGREASKDMQALVKQIVMDMEV
ncbi:hypothetical protein EJ05DRAFT_478156 [Pseudovirgaria hyperparasitica]|uniref:Purine nucleoside phosphorylase n=1 Tax=Pseudovirgaria hyperparasitica TaxID=470096 RepID=A0A6A6W500_9PEZI|nr:uncharacterized protein EJ05DRAFT_478156 [Pseudovirgaria hyperparasitica]KAF2756131.1 hypothetical protein EJ05DRAFT_478156 [Pseudovirgaria hyperparasitica]